jgi:hypothetical protein
MLEYELNGKIYTESDLIKAAGGKDKLSAYIKSKGYKVSNKKAPESNKPYSGKDVDFSEINRTQNKMFQASSNGKLKPKAVAKKVESNEITWEDLKAEESTVAEGLGKKLSRVGLTPGEATFGFNRITIRGDKNQPLYSTINRGGVEVPTDLPEVAVGADLSKEELQASAKKLNEYIKIHGNKNYAEQAKKENPTLTAEFNSKIAAPSRTYEEKLKLRNNELITEFKDKETIAKNRLGIKGGYKQTKDLTLTKNDFDAPEKYDAYKVWKTSGQVPLPSEQKLEKFIGEYNDAYRQTKSSEFMSDAPQEQRVMLNALAADKEDEAIETTQYLKAKGPELDKRSKALSDLMVKFEKTPPSALEINEIKKEYFALQNETSEYNKKALANKKDFNNIKAVYNTALKDYNRLNQTSSLLKQTGLGILGGVGDILASGVAGTVALTSPATYKETKSMIKETLLDPIYAEQKAASKELESYQQDLQIKDIKGMKDLGRWGAGVLTQMPSSMAMAVTGEAALPLFFLSGYGSKQYEIASSQDTALNRLEYNANQMSKGLVAPEDMSEIQKQIASDKRTLNISEGEKITSQLLAGTAEVLFEKYGTLGIIKETNNILRAIPQQEIKRQLKTIGKEMGKSAGVEAWTEGLTQVANNFGDIYLLGQDKNYFDGVSDSMAGGAFMGPGFSAVGGANTIGKNITKAVVSEIATKEEFKTRDKKLEEIKKLTGLTDITGLTKKELNKLILQPPVRKAVEELVDQIDGDDLKILDRLGKDLSIGDAKKVGDFNQKLRKITKDWNEASVTSGIDDAQLRSLKEYYQKQYSDAFDGREAILTDKQLAGKNKKESAKKRILFEATGGSGIYNYRLTRKTYLERRSNFDNLSPEDKQKYNDQATSEFVATEGNIELSNEKINNRAKELYAGEEIGKQLDRDIEAANDFSTESGLNVKVETINSEKELLEKYGNIIGKEDLQDILDGQTNAFNIDDNTLAVYKPNAIKNGHTSSGSHEVLHTLLSKAFISNQEEANKNGIKLLEYLKEAQPSLYAAVEQRMKAYDPEKTKAYGEEVFNALSDSFSDGKIPNDNVFTQLSKAVNRITKGAFGESETFDISNINTNSGKALFDTIKAYSRKAGAKKTKNGKNIRFINADIEDELFAEASDVNNFRASKSKVIEVQKKIDKLEDQFDNDEIEYDDYTGRLEALEEELVKAKAAPEETEKKPEVKKVVTDEDEVKEIIKNERGSVASDKVQKIYEEEGEKGAGKIIKLFKPITAKIVAKRRDAPGFNEEDLTSEIENGAGGLFDLIRSYDASKGVPLAAYINKNLPLRAITSSRRILEGEFKKDVTEEKGIMAEETVTEAKEKPKYRNALEANVFPSEVLKTATNKIITIVRTLKSRIDAPVTLNRTVTPLISEIRDEVGKQLDIDIKTMLGGKKDGVLEKELLRTKKYILENMTTTWLMGKDGQGGIPQAIQKQIDGKWASFPDWVGQKIDREKTTTDLAGRTSGAELVRRLPNVNNNVSNEDFLAQIIGPDGNPIRGRKESVSKAMSEEGAFDIINADFAEEGPIFQAFAINQERLGYEIASNTIVDFARQADRGNIKKSKTYNSFNNTQKELFNSKINDLSIALSPYLTNPKDRTAVLRVFKNIFVNDFSTEEIKNLVEDFRPWLKQMRDIYDPRGSKLEDKNFDFNNFIKNVATMHEEGVLDVLNMNFSHESLFSPANVTDARATTINMFSDWVDKFGLTQATKMMIYSGGTFKSNAALGNLIGIKINPQTKKVELSGEKGRKSNQIAESADDYWDNIVYNSLPGGFSAANELLVTQIKKATSLERKKDSAKESYKDKDFEGRKKQSLEYRKIVQDTFSYYFNPENKVSDAAKAIMIVQMGSNMETAIRKSAILTHLYVPKKGITVGALRYEHTRPASQVIADILKAYKSGKGVVDQAILDDIWSTYTAAVIPVVMDDNFNTVGFKSKMPPGWKKGMPTYYRYYNYATFGKPDMFAIQSIDPKDKGAIIGEKFVKASDAMQAGIENNTKIEAVNKSYKPSKTAKGISVFDFDDTTGITKSNVLYTMPDGTKGKLNAEEFAKEAGDLSAKGAEFDFSEFSKVVGGKPGPMVEKMKKMIGKFGSDNFFILTARPANAAGPIHEFLSSIGIDIPIENITGLGNGNAQAKADWMIGKAAEGYNDFYFADDAIQNVKAVQDALDVLDVKSKIQQARIKFSKTMSNDFNRIIEENTGMEDYKVFSDITAKRRGANKNKFDFYVPPSAADFELLLYKFMGKGAMGEEQKKFFEEALVIPYINGVDLMDAARQSIKRNYKELLKSFPEVRKELEKLTPNKDFTYDQAMRVAIWNQFGTEIPGLSQRDVTYLSDLINNDPDLAAFKDGLIVMGRQEKGWLPPDDFWDANTIISDLYNITEGSGRKKFLGEFIENTENIFGKWENGRLVGPNMNKVEAVYGTNVREALEDSIYRMINGKNRSYGQDKETAAWSSWVNGSTGAIMFLNTRSAALQMLGAINFLNWRDNNPFNAGKAFLNQPQYWKDFARIWNSDKLKERRGGLREDVASAEIANAAASSKNKAVAVTSYLLKIGYTPTQLADSFAIAMGGAPFYRNRINTYLKEGLTETEAEAKAWEEFSKVSDETQQSGDPKDISKQQSSGAGRLLLVFQNFTMQQSRIVKKAALDLKNRRGDDKTNISKIVYYLAVQNILFSTLQQGLFAVLFDDDDDEDKKKKKRKDAAIDVANGVLDSILRGTGFVGGVIATLKNTVVKYLEEKEKKQKAEYAKVVLEAANMSPPIGSKLRKVYSSLQQTKFDKDLIEARGWGVMQDGRVHLGPMYSVSGKLVEVGTNFPMDRLVNKVENLSQAFNSENTTVQRLATGLGYSPWTVGIEGTKGDLLIKETAKKQRKEEGVVKAAKTRRENKERLKDSIKGLSNEERMNYNKTRINERIEKRRKKILMLKKLNENK